MERFEKVLKASFEGRERRAVMESERQFKNCAPENALLIKILSEEVHFKTSFEGMEAVTVKRREF